jgi:SAM-dependent methyltransferase
MTTRVKRDFYKEDWETYYRRYQATLAREYLIPIFQRWGVDVAGKRLLEVGCGNGGCGAEFARAGCNVVMMDIDERLVALAGEHNEREGIDAEVFAGDVLDGAAPFWRRGPFDIVMFRDVMEHIESPSAVLRIAGRFLSPSGVILVVFPPYYSPYGGHQQILPRKRFLFVPYNKLPYLQLLPRRVFLRLARGDGPSHREVVRLSSIRLTIRKFEGEIRRAGFEAREKKTYLSRPSFALRYGLPVIESGILGRIPVISEVAVTAAYYLVAPVAEGPAQKRKPR